MINNLINIDYFKQVYYKSLLPLNRINNFLAFFEKEDVDYATKLLISTLNLTITSSILENFNNIEDKKSFLRLYQDDYQNPEIMNYLIDKFPGSNQIIIETIERTILSATKAISE